MNKLYAMIIGLALIGVQLQNLFRALINGQSNEDSQKMQMQQGILVGHAQVFAVDNLFDYPLNFSHWNKIMGHLNTYIIARSKNQIGVTDATLLNGLRVVNGANAKLFRNFQDGNFLNNSIQYAKERNDIQSLKIYHQKFENLIKNFENIQSSVIAVRSTLKNSIWSTATKMNARSIYNYSSY